VHALQESPGGANDVLGTEADDKIVETTPTQHTMSYASRRQQDRYSKQYLMAMMLSLLNPSAKNF
jgi:hypothetical protein